MKFSSKLTILPYESGQNCSGRIINESCALKPWFFQINQEFNTERIQNANDRKV